MPPSDLCDGDAVDLAGLLRAKQVSAREVVAAYIKRIEEVNPAVNAVVTSTFDQALQKAAIADEAFARGDMDAVLADMDDGIEWQQAQGLPHGGVYHGIAEVRANIFDPLDRDWWSEFSAVPDEFLDAGDEVIVLGRYRGVAKQTGKVDNASIITPRRIAKKVGDVYQNNDRGW